MCAQVTESDSGNVSIDLSSLSDSVMRLRLVGLVLTGLLIVDAVMMWSANIWTGSMTLFIAFWQLVILGSLSPRFQKRDRLRDAGNVVVQHNWLVLSIAVAALAIYPSPFFAIPTHWFAIAMLVALGWAVIALISLNKAVNEAGARLTI